MEINYTSSQFLTYRDLMRTLQKLIYTSWGTDKIRFTSAYPKKTDNNDIQTPIITYKIMSKVPGKFKDTTERKARLREKTIIKDKDDKDIMIEFMGQVFDYSILFEIWADDGDAADELAEKFQRFMSQYAGYLKKLGVKELFFESMFDDNSENQWKTELSKRSITYYIRLEEVTGIHSPTIENIEVGTKVYDGPYNMLLNAYLTEKDPTRDNLYDIRSTISNDDN